MAYVEDFLAPAMIDLLECAEIGFQDDGRPPGMAHLVPGLTPAHSDCCENGGTLWVRVLQFYPASGPSSAGGSLTSPARNTGIGAGCHPMLWNAQVGVGIVRCTPTFGADGESPPTAQQFSVSALEMLRDRVVLETAIRCCFVNPDRLPPTPGLQKVTIGTWAPQGALGGCAGGEWLLDLTLGVCACPEDPPLPDPPASGV